MVRSALATVAALLLAACTTNAQVAWRDIELELPEGWVVAEREDTRLSIANAAFGDPGREDELEAAIFLTHEPGASPDDWRQLVREIDGDLEVDRRRTIDGVPATELVFSHDGNGTPLRELVVVVPSREVVLLAQPVVRRGDRDGPARFERYRRTFDAVVASLRFGAPALDQGPGRG